MKKSLIFAVVIIIFIAILTLLFYSNPMKLHKDTNQTPLKRLDDVPRAYWSKLADKRIFFGYQSVGYNIIDGIRDLIDEHDFIKLNIVETTDPAALDQPVFAHARVGKNTQPTSKIDHFRDIMDTGMGDKVDIAFLKFCYVDVTRDSDPNKIITNYKKTVDDLILRYPKTRFLHVTVPVSSAPTGVKFALKELIKSLIGKRGVLDDNIKRQQYNVLLSNTYAKKQNMFDLALTETIDPDGFRHFVEKDGEKTFVMVNQYTEDGGHLNKQGRRKVAEQLLIKLAGMANH